MEIQDIGSASESIKKYTGVRSVGNSGEQINSHRKLFFVISLFIGCQGNVPRSFLRPLPVAKYLNVFRGLSNRLVSGLVTAMRASSFLMD